MEEEVEIEKYYDKKFILHLSLASVALLSVTVMAFYYVFVEFLPSL